MSKSRVQQWLEYDQAYTLNNHYGTHVPNKVRSVERMNSLVLLSAPHSVHHYRSSQYKDKQSDARTGGLCDLLGDLMNFSSISASSFRTEWHSWHERNDDYKIILQTAVAQKQFVVDLHGMNNDHGADIMIGLGPKPSDRVKRIAQELSIGLQPLTTIVGGQFGAKKSYTVTSHIQSLGGDGLQIEIAYSLRDLIGDPARAELFVDSLLRVFSDLRFD